MANTAIMVRIRIKINTAGDKLDWVLACCAGDGGLIGVGLSFGTANCPPGHTIVPVLWKVALAPPSTYCPTGVNIPSLKLTKSNTGLNGSPFASNAQYPVDPVKFSLRNAAMRVAPFVGSPPLARTDSMA